MYEIIINRFLCDQNLGMIGELRLYKNGKELYKCNTCENLEVGVARNRDLAIPYGEYNTKTHTSSKFNWKIGDENKHEHLLLFNDEVPADRYILIHAGNSHHDTKGCILVGVYRDGVLVNSRITLQDLHKKLYRANINLFDRCKVRIENSFKKN